MGLWGSKDERAEASATDAEKNEFHKLLQECQGLTKDLVRDVVDLLRSLDLMMPTTQILKDNLTISVDKMDHGSTGEILHLEKCQRAALQLLLATEGIQLCQKQGTMNTLDRLLQFIKKLVQMEFECKPGSFGEDLLEGYMKGTETTKTIEEKHSDAPETLKSDHKKKKKPDLIKDITHLEKANSDLKQKVIHLERKYASFYSEKKTLNENIKTLENQLEIACAEKKFKDMSNDLANTCVLEDQLEQLSSKRTKFEEETAALNEKIDLLNEENGRLTSQLISVDIDKANLETELKQMTKLEREKETEVVERGKDKRHNEELQMKLTEEIDNLKKKLKDTETRTTASAEECEQLKEYKRILEKENDEHAKRNKSLESELKQKSEEHKVLCEQNDEKIKGLNRMETKLNELIKEREESAKLIKTLQKAIDNFDSVLVKSDTEKDEMKKERANEKKRDEELRVTLAEESVHLKQKIQDTETRIKTSIEERERLKEENRILEKERDEEAQRNKTLQSEIKQVSEKHKLLCEKKDEKITELKGMETKLNETIKEREEENARLITTFQTANEKFGSLMLKSEREKEEIKNERANENKRHEELRIKLTGEIGDLTQKLQDSETRRLEECERLKIDNRTLEKNRDEEAQRNRSLETEFSQKSKENKVLCEQTDKKIEELNRMQTKLNEIIQDREEENTRLITTFQTANDKFGSLMLKSEREKEEIKIERANENKRHEELRIKLVAEIEDLRLKLQDTETRRIEECERLKENNRTLEKNRNEEAQRNSTLETELSQKSKEHKVLCEQKDKRIEELNRIETKLNSIIKNRKEENARLITTFQNTNDKFGSLMLKSEREKEEIKKERANENTRHEELRIKLTGEIGDLRQKFQDAETRNIDICERLKEDKCILEKEKDKEAQRIKILETELTKTSGDYKVQNGQKDERIKELINTEKQLHANMKEKEVENAQLSKTLKNANDNFHILMKRFETDKEMLVREMNIEKKQKEELQNELANTIDNFQQQIQKKEVELNDLTVVGSKMKSKEIEYQCCLKEKEQKINELVNLNKIMQKQQLQDKEDYDNEKTSLESENQRVQRQVDMLRGDLKTKSDSEKKLLEEVRVLRDDFQENKEHIEKINNQHENMKLQLTNEISAIMEAHSKEKNTMEDRERSLECDLENVRSSNKTLNDQICKERNAIKENENFIAGLNKQMTHIEEEKTKLETQLTKITQDLENCTAENETMRNELEKIKSRKVIQIQMYSQSGVGLLSSVEDELKCVLKSQMDVEESVDVDIIICAKASDIQPNIPLLILCIQASRLGTAVSSTVQGLTLTPKMAVLIFHHKDVHALPNQASERVLTGQELRSLGGIFDLAFLSGKGIYPCEMNRSNFISLVNFIKREGTKRIRDDL